ncbi:MAG: hypothetical protein HRU40_12685 [Saprospiraceae bacterium]|nr:hypothetical protein [Saprospiraceae bacterium]
MNETEFSPHDSLAVITKMIEEARYRYQDNGVAFILWGISLALVGIIHFVLNMMNLPALGGIVYTLLIVPGILTGVYYSRIPKSKGSNVLSRIMKWIWIAITINLFILGFGFFFKLGYNLTPVMLIIQGFGLLLSGYALGNRYLLGAGIFTQALGYVAFFLPNTFQPLVFVAVGIVALLLPGLDLNRKKKKNHV